jgi:hypothetical protein
MVLVSPTTTSSGPAATASMSGSAGESRQATFSSEGTLLEGNLRQCLGDNGLLLRGLIYHRRYRTMAIDS